MLQYVDSFTCSATENMDVISIKFIQHEPFAELNENQEEVIRTQTNEVASVVMSLDCAKGLLNLLSDLIENSDS